MLDIEYIIALTKLITQFAVNPLQSGVAFLYLKISENLMF